MIASGKILVNGEKTKASYVLSCNDVITIEEEVIEEADIKPQDIDLDIIYEDEHIIVANKEKGMVVHPR